MMPLVEQIAEVLKEYPKLRLNGGFQIIGQLPFKAKYCDHPLITDSFDIEMNISPDYPLVLPVIKERERRTEGYPHVDKDLIFCLGAPLAIRKKFSDSPTLLGYLTQQVIPFLYSFRFWQEYGYYPFGDLPHGGEGILQYFREHFNVNSDLAVLELLSINIVKQSRSRNPCPCGSGKRLNKCHWLLLQETYSHQSRNERMIQFQQALDGYYIKYKKKPAKFQSGDFAIFVQEFQNSTLTI